jgi:CheY-like chemotaxis protein
MQAAGITVELAGDGDEAIQYLLNERRCYDAVLMDLQLPTLDGFQAARSIRSDPRCQGLPIIAMTAYTLPEERDHCLAAGMNDYLAKPVSLTQLLDTLARWTGKRVMPDSTGVAIESAATPPALPGLELETALQRLGGDHQLLCELLERMAEDYSDAAIAVRAALSRKDLVLARRLAHTVRGVAGSIGATTLQDAAAAVEQSLRVGALPEEKLVQALAAALTQTLESIVLARRDWAPSPRLDSPARPELHRGLRELLVRLERQALSAVDLFQSLRQSLLEAQPELSVKPLGQSIERLDFKTASRLLHELASQLGIPLEGD